MNNYEYAAAVGKMRQMVKSKQIDAFLASTVLANLFDEPKEKTLDDLLDIPIDKSGLTGL